MGPQMCDNSEADSKEIKNKFMEVLKDYRVQINSKIKQEQKSLELVKNKINERLEDLSKKHASLKKEADMLSE
jgi:hypothetical protein